MVFRYLHRPHRPGEVAPRTHPIPQAVEIVPLPLPEPVDADGVHARRSAVRSDLLPRPKDETLRNLKRLHLLLRSLRRLLLNRVGHRFDLACTAPSLQPHYRTLTATTSCPAPVPRIGTLPLAVFATWGPPSRDQRATFTHLCRPPVSRRQVLHFHASACDELTPPIHRTPPEPHTGSSLAESTPTGAPLSRRPGPILSFDAIVVLLDASAVVHTRSSSRRTPDPVTPGLFPQRSPRRLLTDAASGGLGSPPARRARRAKPPSLAQHRFVLATSYITTTLLSWTHDLWEQLRHGPPVWSSRSTVKGSSGADHSRDPPPVDPWVVLKNLLLSDTLDEY